MQQVINRLTQLINEYTIQFNNIPLDEFMHKPAPGKWSKKEIIGHLIDSAQNNIQRFVRAQYLDNPHIIYNQEAWVAAANYQQYNRTDLIELWVLLNKHICNILATMPPNMYSRQCNIGREQDRLVTIQFLADDYIAHHLHHINQIFSK